MKKGRYIKKRADKLRMIAFSGSKCVYPKDLDGVKNCDGYISIDVEKQPELYSVMKAFSAPYYSDAYLQWVKQAQLPPLTNTQFKFAEFLLKEENVKEMQKIGDLNIVFESVRKWVKTFPEILEPKK